MQPNVTCPSRGSGILLRGMQWTALLVRQSILAVSNLIEWEHTLNNKQQQSIEEIRLT